jgi:hypothetical protein
VLCLLLDIGARHLQDSVTKLEAPGQCTPLRLRTDAVAIVMVQSFDGRVKRGPASETKAWSDRHMLSIDLVENMQMSG